MIASLLSPKYLKTLMIPGLKAFSLQSDALETFPTYCKVEMTILLTSDERIGGCVSIL